MLHTNSLPDLTMTQQHVARWYDTNPKLAFAINLLQLAPRMLQNKAFDALSEYLKLQWSVTPGSLPHETAPKRQRWYDFSDEAANVVSLIKASPESVREATANRLMDILSEAA